MKTATLTTVVAAAAALALSACGGVAASSSSSAAAGSTSLPSTTSAGATTSSGAGGATVVTGSVGGKTVLVAASNQLTLYQFSQDQAGSGTSACVGSCASEWPPLMVPTGTVPSGPGIAGQWGTITRSDGAGTQATYNGKPLYFHSGDSKAGDDTGNYPGWSDVPVGTAGAAPSSAAASPSSTGYGY